jgi:hypothetical protein
MKGRVAFSDGLKRAGGCCEPVPGEMAKSSWSCRAETVLVSSDGDAPVTVQGYKPELVQGRILARLLLQSNGEYGWYHGSKPFVPFQLRDEGFFNTYFSVKGAMKE